MSSRKINASENLPANTMQHPTRNCHGYPPLFLKTEPKQEINFFLPFPIPDKDGKRKGLKQENNHLRDNGSNNKNVKQQTKYLACSWITASSTQICSEQVDQSPIKSYSGGRRRFSFRKRKAKEPPSLQVPSPTETRTTILNSVHKDLIKIDTSKKVIIICHGLFSWRNQMLIANIASLLSSPSSLTLTSNRNNHTGNNNHCDNFNYDDYHTLRFDFTGNGHSSGEFTYAPHQNDFEDLNNVYNFITGIIGCEVCCIVGHSQGSCAILKHAAMMDQVNGTNDASFHINGSNDRFKESEKETIIDRDATTEMTTFEEYTSKSNTKYVNLSGRFTSPNVFQPNEAFTPDQCQELEQNGRFQIQTWSGGRTFEVTEQSIKDRIAYDIIRDAAVDRITESKVLTIHGDDDQTVPVENAHKFDQIIPNHTIKIIPGANHNFNGLKYVNTIVSSILDFIDRNT